MSPARDQDATSGMLQLPARATLVLAIALISLFAAAPSADAQTFDVIYRFTGTHGDGANSTAGLVRDSAGNLYGTTSVGGNGAGTVFKLSLSQDGVWTETILYTFNGSSDGAFPAGGLILDSAGNLYGTTTGTTGTVFRLTPAGEHTVLYAFCSLPDCADGTNPNGGLVRDAAGNLYGTTSLGGNPALCEEGCGTVYKVDPAGNETVLYSFCAVANCADGSFPIGGGVAFPEDGLVLDAAGNLYGTTPTGGNAGFCADDRGCGTVYKVDPSGNETVLHSFCSDAKCADGSYPDVGLTQDAAGNLYGTTESGGAHIHYGTVFKLDAVGNETVLHSFSGHPVFGPLYPSGLVLDAKGNLYGTTNFGGTFHQGSVFKVTKSGQARTLYSFTGGREGAPPGGGLVLDPAGNLYGTTEDGGYPHHCHTYGCGVVFKLTP
ncbi:MAG: choice-of-anchor tandem repeat GloVer-containing protein [Terriglobales bacterium]